MDFEALTRIAFYIAAAVAAIFLVEAVYLALARPIVRSRGINRRLKALNDGVVGEQALLRLKAERGNVDGELQLRGWLRRLLIHSGLRITFRRFLAMLATLLVAIMTGLKLLTILEWPAVLAIATVVGIVLPLAVVRLIRSKRQAAFARQLPDALDIIVRSLKSGHPVPVAIAMVGREMSDPIGSEFGVTIDEMTYGLDLPRALRNLADRVGLADLSLLVTAVSIQNSAGGNLSEILGNLSKVLRDRFQLRRKVRALSAEGKISAYGLTVLPFAISGAIFVQNPPYYLDVWDEPVFLPALAALGVWALIGDLIMYKMINFKY
jgi:tight adherence protein B